MAVEQVLQEVGALVARVAPGHGRADGAHLERGAGEGCAAGPRAPGAAGTRQPHVGQAHHAVGVAAMAVHTVPHQLLLVQVAGAAVGAGEGGPVGDGAGAAWAGERQPLGMAHPPAAWRGPTGPRAARRPSWTSRPARALSLTSHPTTTALGRSLLPHHLPSLPLRWLGLE